MSAKPSLRRRERFKASLREFVFSGCTAAGGLLALAWAVSLPPVQVKCPVLAACVARAFGVTAVPILLRCGAGATAGAVVGRHFA